MTAPAVVTEMLKECALALSDMGVDPAKLTAQQASQVIDTQQIDEPHIMILALLILKMEAGGTSDPDDIIQGMLAGFLSSDQAPQAQPGEFS